MKKIVFEDLPSTNTPIDSDNLNLLQDNVEEAIEEKQSLPMGGTTGQVLGKNSDTDFDVSWINQTGGGSADYDSLPVGSVIDYDGDDVPVGYEEVAITNNIVTDGDPVPTGRIIDGKIEYIKRFDCGQLPNASMKLIDTDLDLDTMILTGMSGVSTNSGRTFAYFLPNALNNEIAVRFGDSGTNYNKIIITTDSDRSAYTETYIDITFIYR